MFDAIASIRQQLEKKDSRLYYYEKNSNSYLVDGSTFKQTSNRSATVELLPKDGLPVLCSSSFFTILFCRGNGTVEIAGNKINCFAGNIILFRDGCDFVLQSEVGSDILIAYYEKESLDSLFYSQVADLPIFYDFFRLEDCHNEFLYFDSSMSMEINHFTQSLLLELCEKKHYSENTIQCSTILFLTNLHRIHQDTLVISESSMMSKYLIGNILKYMANNCSIATLNSTATHFNYHPAYFSAMFKRLANATFTKKLMELRMERARRMLDYTNLSVKDIWQSTGFEEHSHFHRTFKGTYGVTPYQYRKKVQNLK
jgi:AraC-like DNA-binding protein